MIAAATASVTLALGATEGTLRGDLQPAAAASTVRDSGSAASTAADSGRPRPGAVHAGCLRVVLCTSLLSPATMRPRRRRPGTQTLSSRSPGPGLRGAGRSLGTTTPCRTMMETERPPARLWCSCCRRSSGGFSSPAPREENCNLVVLPRVEQIAPSQAQAISRHRSRGREPCASSAGRDPSGSGPSLEATGRDLLAGWNATPDLPRTQRWPRAGCQRAGDVRGLRFRTWSPQLVTFAVYEH